MFLVAACDEKKTADPSATPSATTATSASSAPVIPSATASATASAQPAASAPSAAPSGKRMFGCKTKVGDAKLTIDVLDAGKGSPTAVMKVDSKAGARSLNAATAPHAATYSLVFSGYGEGDKHPAAEPALVAGDTLLGRLVSNGDKMEFYADKGFPTHPAKDGPYICDKE